MNKARTERSRWYKPSLTLAVIVLLTLASVVQQQLNRTRRDLGLTRVEPLENAPPVLALTTQVLGGFRGLIANVLWVRASTLQDEGKYFEMVQLSDWITKLQPYIPTVWYHLAWNMAYNISIKFQDPADRWHWVRRGVELLRDEALRYNPKNALLYRELAWFFQHKIGYNLDDAHMYYKTVWAQEMQSVLGNQHPDFDLLINPPDPETAERVRRLREVYKMDPAIMKAVDEEYGPLEWRLPETSAIYWAYAGLEKSEAKDLMTLRRVIYQSMQLAFHRGRFIENPYDQTIEFGPNLDIIPQVSESYLAMQKEEPDMAEHIGRAHRNFLKDAVYFLFTHNRLKDAAYWFNYIHENYPDATLTGTNMKLTDVSLDQYAVNQVTEIANETSQDKVKALVEGYLSRAYYLQAIGEDDQSAGHALLARKMYQQFERKTSGATQRVGLPPLALLQREVLNRMLDPQQGLSPQLQAQLRTALNLPPPTVSNTNTNAIPNTPPAPAPAEGTQE